MLKKNNIRKKALISLLSVMACACDSTIAPEEQLSTDIPVNAQQRQSIDKQITAKSEESVTSEPSSYSDGKKYADKGYKAISINEMHQFVGKTVYVAVTTQSRGSNGKYFYAGEAVTLLKADKSHTKSGNKTYDYVTVSSERGVSGEISHYLLSGNKMLYDLTNPGTPEALVKNIMLDAFLLPEQYNRLSYATNTSFASQSLVTAMRKYFDFAKTLVRTLVNGTRKTEESVMADKEYGWALLTDNDQFLSWLASGVPDKVQKKHLRNAISALSDVYKTGHFLHKINENQQLINKKPWRNGMDHIPVEKLAALDKKKTEEHLKSIEVDRRKIEKLKARAEINKNSLSL